MSYLNNTLKRYCKGNSLKEKIRIILTNRGFQSVIVYRISNLLYKKKLGFYINDINKNNSNFIFCRYRL